ncbi:660_t:CDS:1, partial [Scutellospora calospora]
IDPIHKLTPKFCPKLREIVLHGVEVADFDTWFGEHKDLEVDQCDKDETLSEASRKIFQDLEILDLIDTTGFFNSHFNMLTKYCLKIRKVRMLRTSVVYSQVNINNGMISKNDSGWVDLK